MAAITGIAKPSNSSKSACPWRARLSASAAERQSLIMRISAPATNEDSLPLINTTPFKSLFDLFDSSNPVTSSTKLALSVFIDSPGTSMVTTAMPLSCMSSVNAFCFATVIILSPQLLQQQGRPLHARLLVQYHRHGAATHVAVASSYARPMPQMGGHRQSSYQVR